MHEGIDPKVREEITAQFGELPEFDNKIKPSDLYPYTVDDYVPQDGYLRFGKRGEKTEYILIDPDKGTIARRELNSYYGTLLYWDGNYQIKYNHSLGANQKIHGISANISYHKNPRKTYDDYGQLLAWYNSMVFANGETETYISIPFPLDYVGQMRFADTAPGWQIETPGTFSQIQMFIDCEDAEQMRIRGPHPKTDTLIRPIQFGEVVAPKELRPATFRALETAGLVTFEYMPVDVRVQFPFKIDYQAVYAALQAPKGWETFNQTLPLKLFMSHGPELSAGSMGYLPEPGTGGNPHQLPPAPGWKERFRSLIGPR